MTTHDTQSADAGDSRPMLDTITGTVSSHGAAVKLTRTEQAILARLMQSPGQVLSRDRLYESLYDERPDSDWPESKIIDVFICKLRNKLGRIGCWDVIQTVRGRGFRLAGPAPVIAFGLTSSEWTSLQIVVAAAERNNLAAAATIRSAMQRLAA